jgi:hypothetical protein
MSNCYYQSTYILFAVISKISWMMLKMSTKYVLTLQHEESIDIRAHNIAFACSLHTYTGTCAGDSKFWPSLQVI